MQTIRRNLIWVGWELAHNSFTISATNWTVSFSNKKTIRCNSISTGRCTRKLGSFVIHSKHPERWLKKLHTVLWELENLIFGKLGEVGNVMIHNSCETWFFHQNFLKMIYDAREGPADQARHWNPSHPASHPFKLMKMTKAWQGGHAWQGGSVADQ